MPVQGIVEIVRRVLPPDDSSLQWSATSGGFSANVGETFGQLYARMVERYARGDDVETRSDEDIAKPFNRIPGHRELVNESEVETFAESVAMEMASHPEDNR